MMEVRSLQQKSVELRATRCLPNLHILTFQSRYLSHVHAIYFYSYMLY